ncbi:hypothetical protein X560_1361 [Listeria fleischmannii 1991]|uniref:DUF4064 domain-containing protein n=2 Tax=Listeria fleischmannii TaxID=1069827 RepID=A0A2X3H885_9LIST|nr:DUF4064 domain-containing protein [Listeria fleischmannii]EMG27791.1 hypothetical protein LFLEISCH_09292 [Listeria fleischmannii subsp. fleischmannii LU2006-1]KMT59422.1 hypothetical protein X560_1361 [Listeria fleischmannii 1991]SQC66925.1 Uncharacterised protein [Listeria fleischmannii subsp. fleischmannii]
MNNRKAEFILGIIGSSLAAVGVLLTGIITMFVVLATSADHGMMTQDEIIGISFSIGFIGLNLLLALVSCVFGFIASFKLKNGVNVKGWSILLIVIGALCFFSYGFITGVLFLIAGIMSVSKRQSEKNQFDSFE